MTNRVAYVIFPLTMVAMHRLDDRDCARIGAALGFVKPTVFEARTA